MDTKRFPEGSQQASAWPAWLVLALIVLVRIPFLLIHPLQEDAYITFRAARHLAEYGDFSFNLHQHFPGTTSLLYPLIVAAIDLLSRSYMVLGVQLFATLCIAGACWFIARALCDRPAEQLIVWLLTACWPIALVMSYTGMETPLLALTLGVSIFALARETHWTFFAASVLVLPLVRPDAIAYGLIFCAAMFFIHRRAAVLGSAALAVGCGLFLLGTRITTGHFLSTTARAKEIAYHPDHSAAAVAGRMRDLFFSHSFLLPTPTNYLIKLSPLVLVVVAVAFALAFRYAHSHRERTVLGALTFATIAIPLAYAYGGVLFSWYLYPANWIAAAVTIAVLVRIAARGRFPAAGMTLLAVVWIGLIFMQWTKALAGSTQDYHYRGDIGRYLATISHSQGTLFLEPAGLIPYFSGLRTDDEIGLVSARVTEYMQRNPDAWWFDYVAAEQPDYIVERQSFDHYRTIEGYTLTPDQQRWFAAHYQLLRRVHYVPSAYHPSPFLQRILAMGPIEDYLIYGRRSAAR
ncbi:MAG TPA: hypothetical protein VGG59_00105 [Acidobacteriaceae bacterium]